MGRQKICISCKRYTPSEKLDWPTFQRMCLKYTGWCMHYREERDDNEPICENYVYRNSQGKVKA